MRISAKTDYAVRALIEVGRHAESRQPKSADEIAAAQDIPRNFLLALLADMRRAGLVASQRGKSGGWVLAKPPSDIAIADVIRATDGPLISVHGVRPEDAAYHESAALLQWVWIATRSSLREVLEQVTLAHLIDGALPDGVSARTTETDVWESR